MDPLEMQKIGESHAYKFIWVISIAILAIAIAAGLIFWYQSGGTISTSESTKAWTSNDKREALENLDESAKAKGVVPLTAQEKMELMKKLGNENKEATSNEP